ncbi:hypothetical protein JCM17092_14830 [Haloplanus litoreus]
MLPTHAIGGMLVALPVALAMPELSSTALVAGFLGGVLPDLDMYVGHRKTLHYPVYYSVAGGIGVLAALLVPSTSAAALASLFLAAAVHCVADAYGGGLELRPWEGTSRRAVYDHYHGRWIAPRPGVRYDGSPSDLLLATVLAVPLLVVVDAPYSWLVAGSLTVAAVYTAVRRTLPALVERLVSALPTWTRPYLPARYRIDGPTLTSPRDD